MSRDLRYYARQTNIRIAIGAVLVLFIVGDGLIYFNLWAGSCAAGFFLLAFWFGPGRSDLVGSGSDRLGGQAR